MKKTWFIADLHLDPCRPAMIHCFLRFVDSIQTQAEALYILGDLFEYWIGDDVLQYNQDYSSVTSKLKQLSDYGVAVYFIAGNRDFLIADGFVQQTACQILDENHIIDLYGVPTLIMHGDTLCTDDVDYLQLRSLLRSQVWQSDFLSLSISDRIEQALVLRNASKAQTTQKTETILDVNQQAVMDIMKHYHVLQLIHGHTHRMASHYFDIDGKKAKRFVLGDWYNAPHYLTVSPNNYTMA